MQHAYPHVFILAKVDRPEFRGLPVAAMVRVSSTDLLALVPGIGNGLRQSASIPVQSTEFRWLSSIAFTEDNRLAAVPGFFCPDDPLVFLDGLENIDESENNGRDVFEEACTVYDGGGFPASLVARKFLNATDVRFFFTGEVVDPLGRTNREIQTLDNPLEEVLEAIHAGPWSEVAHLISFSRSIYRSNEMLRALLGEHALTERNPEEGPYDYIDRLICLDFDAGRSGEALLQSIFDATRATDVSIMEQSSLNETPEG